MDGYKLYSVITGDIVESSKAGKEYHTPLLNTLKGSFELVESVYGKRMENIGFDIFRGDSFQVILSAPEYALAATLMIRSSLRKTRISEEPVNWDVRSAIGIGTIDFLPSKVSEGDGLAYRRSGPYLDQMKGDQRLSIITPWEDVNDEMISQTALLDAVIAKWSFQQAEIIPELLQEKSRKMISNEFGISQSAVHYRVKGAGWFAVKKFLERFSDLMKKRRGNV